ncbi:YxeA family protein [Listeria booriae]|uniref:YxeA family protein n=1 Tax=Listeria booriae TaxID=1552123 RepID=A0A7X0XFG2_9LIST|nr:YxeA family protein [Listeria booriae]MBC1291275.1 YxeA family protein [Listeria booriae]MBC1333805.1 YxeA family protein [Listeria booriae]MBC1493239.1 YxeA family protein [Listeria booriae]MBC1503183.1 YxeA family protein [Listeria booriae]MBC1530347.1 YxeA family protein [Listeria booriae]
MKKLFISLIVIIIIIGGVAIAGRFINFHRLGADTYYVKITQDPKTTNGRASDGSAYTDYNYKLPGYDENGKEKDMDFFAQKNLRKDAYLEVFWKEDRGVTSYEEVKKADIPKKAAEKLN